MRARGTDAPSEFSFLHLDRAWTGPRSQISDWVTGLSACQRWPDEMGVVVGGREVSGCNKGKQDSQVSESEPLSCCSPPASIFLHYSLSKYTGRSVKLHKYCMSSFIFYSDGVLFCIFVRYCGKFELNAHFLTLLLNSFSTLALGITFSISPNMIITSKLFQTWMCQVIIQYARKRNPMVTLPTQKLCYTGCSNVLKQTEEETLLSSIILLSFLSFCLQYVL